jgi:hypothetical protein
VLATQAGGHVVPRFAADGREVERLAFAYLLHKTATGWKIAVLAAHPAETMLHAGGRPTEPG